jgi:hypothetical protein
MLNPSTDVSGVRDDDVPLPAERAIGHADDIAHLERTRAKLCDYVRRTLPGLDPNPIFERACQITQLPWGSDHMCVWQSPNGRISFVAGNNMFKLAPRLAESLADISASNAVPKWLDPTTSR